MIAISAGVRSNARSPPASMSATSPNGLTHERRVTTRSGSPMARISRPSRVDLDDVAAMAGSPRCLADLADQDRRRQPCAAAGPRARGLRPGRARPRPDSNRRAGLIGHAVEDTARRRQDRPACRSMRRPPRAGPPCTSRPTRRSSTSWRCCATQTTEPKKFRELVRELSLAARLRGARRRPRPRRSRSRRRSRRSRRQRAGRPDRARADPAGRPGHGRRDARADAHGPGLAPRPVPRRAHAAAGRVLQQAARLGDRRPVPDPRPDAGHRRLGDGGHRGAQALGRGRASSCQPDRRARGRAPRSRRPTRTWRSTAPRSTASSTRRATSCPAWATPATASSGRAARRAALPGRRPPAPR